MSAQVATAQRALLALRSARKKARDQKDGRGSLEIVYAGDTPPEAWRVAGAELFDDELTLTARLDTLIDRVDFKDRQMDSGRRFKENAISEGVRRGQQFWGPESDEDNEGYAYEDDAFSGSDLDDDDSAGEYEADDEEIALEEPPHREKTTAGAGAAPREETRAATPLAPPRATADEPPSTRFGPLSAVWARGLGLLGRSTAPPQQPAAPRAETQVESFASSSSPSSPAASALDDPYDSVADLADHPHLLLALYEDVQDEPDECSFMPAPARSAPAPKTPMLSPCSRLYARGSCDAPDTLKFLPSLF